jgi:hypothetical protein
LLDVPSVGEFFTFLVRQLVRAMTSARRRVWVINVDVGVDALMGLLA